MTDFEPEAPTSDTPAGNERGREGNEGSLDRAEIDLDDSWRDDAVGAASGTDGSWQDEFDRRRMQSEAPYGDGLVDHRLIPNTALPIGEAVVYQSLSLTSLPRSGQAAVELTEPIDVLSADRWAQAPAEGVLLTHEQAWRMKAVTLGRLLHSTTLAPGEVTQIAVSGWSRQNRGQTDQEMAAQERAARDAGRSRDLHDVVNGVADESTFGFSIAHSSSNHVNAGGGFMGFSAGASHSSSSGSTFGFNVGHRNASIEATQRLRETTHQQAARVRTKRAALVSEVSESETEQFQTRVVANYNHQHSLNVMYYEVLQVFEASTQVTDAARCIFLPMTVETFDAPRARRFARSLSIAARALDALDLADRLHRLDQEVTVRAVRIQMHQDRLGELWTEMGEIQERVSTVRMMTQQVDLEEVVELQVELAELSARGSAAQVLIDQETEDLRSLRTAAATVEGEVLHQLNDRRLLFNQALWMQMSSTQVAAIVGSKHHAGEPLASTIDPTPIGVSGNYVAFRWPFPAGSETAVAAFVARHKDDDATKVDDRDQIVLPTGGVFAEAVAGQSNAAEKIDLTRFWKWDDDTIPILPTAIDRLQQQRRAKAAAAEPGEFGKATLALRAMPDGPPPPQHVLAGAMGAALFRDLSGSDVIQPMVEAAQQASGATASDMQKEAHKNIEAYLDHLEKVGPQVLDFLSSQGGGLPGMKPGGGGPEGEGAEESGGLSPSDVGGLQNALGEEGAGLDIGALAGEAAELGMFLL